MEKAACQTCKNYFITWDSNFPYGCKAFGFKGKVQPILMVKEADGRDCSLYDPKEQKKTDSKSVSPGEAEKD